MPKPETELEAKTLIDDLVADLRKFPPVDLNKLVDIKLTMEYVEKDDPNGLKITKTYHDANGNRGTVLSIQLGILYGELQMARLAMARLPRVPE